METHEMEHAAMNHRRPIAVPSRPSIAALRAKLEKIRDEDTDILLRRAEQEIAASRRRIERLLDLPPVHRPAPSAESAPSPWLAIISGTGEIVGQVSADS
jgi:hypothetical protein